MEIIFPQNKELYQKNKEKLNEYGKEYRQENKEKLSKQQKKRHKKNPIKYWCIHTISSHKKRGFKVLFTWQELLSIAEKTKSCPLCGDLLNWGVENKNGRRQLDSPSLDRLNNDKTLTLKNTKIICWKCNNAKNEMSIKEFINYCKKIYKRNKKATW